MFRCLLNQFRRSLPAAAAVPLQVAVRQAVQVAVRQAVQVAVPVFDSVLEELCVWKGVALSDIAIAALYNGNTERLYNG